MFSYADIRRCELCLAVTERHPADISDDEMDRWQTVGDVARSVFSRADEHPPWELPLTEAEVLATVRELIAAGWDIPPEQVTPDAKLFDNGLQLDCLPFMRAV